MPFTSHLLRTARTLRHVRLRQLAARVWLKSRLRLYQVFPPVATRPVSAVTLNETGLQCLERWQHIKRPFKSRHDEARQAAEIASGRFTFLNRSREYKTTVDWTGNGMSRLWRYHLHYGGYIASLANAAERFHEPAWGKRAWDLIEEWEQANVPGSCPAWEPYPLSLRIVHWASVLSALRREDVTGVRWQRLLVSLYRQAEYLSRHLEWHLGGNHLIKNAKALWVAGLLFDGTAAARWREHGLQLLLSELRHQILPDGGHYERSPMYHGMVLEDVLDCLVLSREIATHDTTTHGQAALEQLRETAVRMTHWFQLMLHPDRSLALFNDSVLAGEVTPDALLGYAAHVLPSCRVVHEQGVTELDASGYYILRSGVGRMIIDCGAVGPDDLPAHAHADTLSYELSWNGRRLIVDSGVAEYEVGELRQYVRSTRAHNTVVVDSLDQSEIWSSHRVGRRAYPVGAAATFKENMIRFTGTHDGYAHLGVLHARHILALDDLWIVVDEVLGQGRRCLENIIHFHPSVKLLSAQDGYLLSAPDLPSIRLHRLGNLEVRLQEGRYCPDWNRIFSNTVAIWSGETDLPAVFGYFLIPPERDVQLEVSHDKGGVSVMGQVGGRAVHLRSERCMSFF